MIYVALTIGQADALIKAGLRVINDPELGPSLQGALTALRSASRVDLPLCEAEGTAA